MSSTWLGGDVPLEKDGKRLAFRWDNVVDGFPPVICEPNGRGGWKKVHRYVEYSSEREEARQWAILNGDWRAWTRDDVPEPPDTPFWGQRFMVQQGSNFEFTWKPGLPPDVYPMPNTIPGGRSAYQLQNGQWIDPNPNCLG